MYWASITFVFYTEPVDFGQKSRSNEPVEITKGAVRFHFAGVGDSFVELGSIRIFSR